MSAVTVTYQELPPMASWAPDAPGHNSPTSAAPPIHFAHLPGQHYQDGDAPSWNTFPLEGLEVKCDGTGGGEWALAGPIGEAPPPPYAASHHVSLYNGQLDSPSVYSTSPKKRFGHIRPPGDSPAGHSLVGIGGAGANMAPEELCLVCGDKASGYHYNALTCEGCKGFFRRSITRKAMYYCKYGGHCDIDMYMRRKCQACRLRKCLDIGMRPELVIPEEQCRLKRESKNKMRALNGPSASAAAPSNTDDRESNSPQQVTSTEAMSPNTSTAGLTPEQRELVHRLVRYQEQYEMPSDQDLAKLSAFRHEHNHQQGNSQFQHLAELTILNVQLIVESTKHLPGFLTLNKEDQLTLLKACSTEILMLRTARRYDLKSDTIVLGNRITSWAYSREAYKQAGMGSATDAIFEFAKSMAKLRVDAAEFALLTAISIFSERPGLVEARKVEDIQEVYTSTLQCYIDAHRPKNRTVFARLLMKLTDLRTLGCEQADVLFSLKGQCRSAGFDDDEPPSKTMKRDQVANEPCPTTSSQRVPNVRIKVEPLCNGQTEHGRMTDEEDSAREHQPTITSTSADSSWR